MSSGSFDFWVASLHQLLSIFWYCQLLHFDMAGLRRLTQNYDDREVEHLTYVLKTCA
jgi:hypothetical protein